MGLKGPAAIGNPSLTSGAESGAAMSTLSSGSGGGSAGMGGNRAVGAAWAVIVAASMPASSSRRPGAFFLRKSFIYKCLGSSSSTLDDTLNVLHILKTFA